MGPFTAFPLPQNLCDQPNSKPLRNPSRVNDVAMYRRAQQMQHYMGVASNFWLVGPAVPQYTHIHTANRTSRNPTPTPLCRLLYAAVCPLPLNANHGCACLSSHQDSPPHQPTKHNRLLEFASHLNHVHILCGLCVCLCSFGPSGAALGAPSAWRCATSMSRLWMQSSQGHRYARCLSMAAPGLQAGSVCIVKHSRGDCSSCCDTNPMC